ncbi:3-methyl-2-oxobutanoate hydroxymethyltransferase [Pleionea litopenaei]|uniref:3-methyl-2-oxobutanoate hydroxymethyltransferase n=1 Tax=Pleionea litopenaei TaxID=3070815 RepID=A0AA51X8E7_9GAMM|nr:3-methyl-2-oxobutanoate hydroxymethyltransferase [Pleionea sp. HL-JVS1]WMS89228.1 3-methyl-2-oxobutanoate hydroxymethyltransferase [Pleionea sp. HL-JVS1]
MKKVTLSTLQQLKKSGEPITVLTAYDATFAKLQERAGVEVILIGDSLGNVIQGHQTTVPVTIEDMCYHIANVARGCNVPLLIGDYSYMSYATPEQAYFNATKLMQAGANMVKLEGGAWLSETIQGLTERGIPVCAHLGLTPQSVDALGGFKVQGKEQASADKLLADALAVEQAGAKLLVLECVPAALAKSISEQLSIPTIGIGAGVNCDGQVLVMHDMLGLNEQFSPKFVKNFLTDSDGDIRGAFEAFVKQVKAREFPTEQHSF